MKAYIGLINIDFFLFIQHPSKYWKIIDKKILITPPCCYEAMIKKKFLTASTILMLISSVSCGLLNPTNLTAASIKYAYEKASEDATIVYQLQSNKPRTTFFIDGKKMGVARRLKVYINNQAHTVTAQAEGCVGKEEYIQPPYSSIAPLGFTYLMGECSQSAKQIDLQPISDIKIYIEDKTPPVININNYFYQNNEVSRTDTAQKTIRGQIVDNKGVSSVRLNDKKISLDDNGYFSVDLSLKVGLNTFKIIAIDNSDNKTEKKIEIKRLPIENISIYKSENIDKSNFGKYFALVIGNNDYQYIQKLNTAVNDAKEIAYVLKEYYGFNTKILLNATRKDILDAINKFKIILNPNDSFIIYYAGHGEKDESAYWLPIDAKADSTTEWIQAETITTELKKFNSNHILIVSDSCYSGELSRMISRYKKRGSRDFYLKKLFLKKSRTLIASGGNEPVADGGGGANHSVFTKAFIDALKNTPDTIFTDDELFNNHIKEIVGGNTEQTPKYSALRNSGHKDGAFIFVKINSPTIQ
jgi:hypothetical protein